MIVVTAPTSNISSQVLDRLLPSQEGLRVIARDRSRLSERTRANAQIIEGSHSTMEVVQRAFEGADTVFWLVPPDIHATSAEAAYVDFSRPAVQAMKDQGVRRVVVVSGLGRGSAHAHDAGLITASLAMEDLIASSGVSLRALTLPSFMDNVARQATSIREHGIFFSPIDANLRLPTCATHDIAAAASTLLLDAAWEGQGHLSVLGPEDLSYNDMARIMSDVLGKSVHYQQISYEDHKAGFLRNGMSEAMAKGMADMYAAKNRGIDQVEPRTSLNTTPTSFRQWCEKELKPLIWQSSEPQ